MCVATAALLFATLSAVAPANSFAQSATEAKKGKLCPDGMDPSEFPTMTFPGLAISNFGGGAGSLEVFAPCSFGDARPQTEIKGFNTGMQAPGVAAVGGVGVSSIAGGPMVEANTEVNAGIATQLFYSLGMFSPGSNGNSAPSLVIASPDPSGGDTNDECVAGRDNSFCTGKGLPNSCCTGPGAGTCGVPFPCCTGPGTGSCPAGYPEDQAGLFVPDGVAFANVYANDEITQAGKEAGGNGEYFAVTNYGFFVLPPDGQIHMPTSNTDLTCGGASGVAFPSSSLCAVTCFPSDPPPGSGIPAGLGVAVTVGTINEYYTSDGGQPGTPAVNVSPINPGLVYEQNAACTSCPVPGPQPPTFQKQVTIGGCNTFLLGPSGIAFDGSNRMFVVDAAGESKGIAIVLAFAPGSSGDVPPIGTVGSSIPPLIAGPLVAPQFLAVTSDGSTLFVSDAGAPSVTATCTGPATPAQCCTGKRTGTCGDPSIKIFDVTNVSFDGTASPLIGTIIGNRTQLKRPLGMAWNNFDGDDLYVVDAKTNSLLVWDDFDLTGGNLPPSVIIRGNKTHINFPVGVAMPEFFQPEE